MLQCEFEMEMLHHALRHKTKPSRQSWKLFEPLSRIVGDYRSQRSLITSLASRWRPIAKQNSDGQRRAQNALEGAIDVSAIQDMVDRGLFLNSGGVCHGANGKRLKGKKLSRCRRDPLECSSVFFRADIIANVYGGLKGGTVTAKMTSGSLCMIL
jgi:hypothetical protein